MHEIDILKQSQLDILFGSQDIQKGWTELHFKNSSLSWKTAQEIVLLLLYIVNIQAIDILKESQLDILISSGDIQREVAELHSFCKLEKLIFISKIFALKIVLLVL